MSVSITGPEGPTVWDSTPDILIKTRSRRRLINRPGVKGTGVLYDPYGNYAEQTFRVFADLGSQALATALEDVVRDMRENVVEISDQFDRLWTMKVVDTVTRPTELADGQWEVRADFTLIEQAS